VTYGRSGGRLGPLVRTAGGLHRRTVITPPPSTLRLWITLEHAARGDVSSLYRSTPLPGETRVTIRGKCAHALARF
jgi:hypothetical protein